MMNQKAVDFPLTLALSPVEDVSSWKINYGGDGTIARPFAPHFSPREA